MMDRCIFYFKQVTFWGKHVHSNKKITQNSKLIYAGPSAKYLISVFNILSYEVFFKYLDLNPDKCWQQFSYKKVAMIQGVKYPLLQILLLLLWSSLPACGPSSPHIDLSRCRCLQHHTNYQMSPIEKGSVLLKSHKRILRQANWH